MPYVKLPYGNGALGLDVPLNRYLGELVPQIHHNFSGKPERQIVREALSHPVDAPSLRELAKGKKKIVLLASDHTRPVPSKIIVPPMLEELRAGNPDGEITILIATGCHRGTTQKELAQKFGPDILAHEHIVVHDCDDADMLVHLGTLPSGGELVINRIAAEADLLVAEGFVEPHFFAGFSGGRKSVLPGIAARHTVLYNHNSSFIANPNARTGILEHNPIHEDMVYAAHAAGLAFICNVVLDGDKKVVRAWAGDVEAAHLKACEFLREQCQVDGIPADIVITSNGGWPLDQNIYQAVKGMTAAEATVRENGVIIMLAECGCGHGGDSFYQTFRQERDLDHMMDTFLATPAEQTIADQWQSQILARVLLRARVILISDVPDDIVRDMHMTPAHSLSEALKLADAHLAERGIQNAGILTIPDGVSVIVH